MKVGNEICAFHFVSSGTTPNFGTPALDCGSIAHLTSFLCRSLTVSIQSSLSPLRQTPIHKHQLPQADASL